MKNKLKLWLKFELSGRNCLCIMHCISQMEKESWNKILIYLKMKNGCQKDDHKFFFLLNRSEQRNYTNKIPSAQFNKI